MTVYAKIIVKRILIMFEASLEAKIQFKVYRSIYSTLIEQIIIIITVIGQSIVYCITTVTVLNILSSKSSILPCARL